MYEKYWLVKGSDSLAYRVLLPKNYDSTKQYPLLLFLHGAGERGNDNEAQLKHGSQLFLQDSIRTNYEAIVVFPQCPANSYWSNVAIETDSVTQTRTFHFKKRGRPTAAMNMLLQLLPQLEKKYPIDHIHRYVAGLSMGAMGTYELVRRMPPGYFAAAIPICGGASPKTADKLEHTKWWIFHGAKDDVVPVHFSEDMAAALKGKYVAVQLTIYPESKHNSWENAFAEHDLLHWLFAQRTEIYNIKMFQ